MNIFYMINKNKKIVLFLFFGIILLIGFLYISTHGSLEVSANNIKKTSYTKLNSGNNYEKIDFTGNKVLQSGDYLIETEFNGGNIELKQISVPGFFQSAVVDSKNSTYKTITLSTNAGQFSGQITQSGVDTFDYSGEVKRSNFETSTVSNKDTNLPKFDNFIYLSEYLIAGYIQSTDTITPFTYNFSNDTTKYFKPITLGSPTTPVTVTQISSSDFGIYTSGAGLQLYTISSSDDNPTKQISFKTQKPALFNETPLITTSSSRIASVSGPDRLLSSDGENTDTSNDFSLKLFSLKGERQAQYKISENSIKGLSISSDGNYTAVNGSSTLGIIDNKTGKNIYKIPESIEDVRWLSTSKFIFTTTNDHLVFIGDINGEAYAVYPKNHLNISAISFAGKDFATFSAIPINSGIKVNPNLYRVDINNRVSLNMLSKLPHQAEGYYLYEVNGVVHIQLTRYIESDDTTSVDNTAMQAAYSYLNTQGIKKKGTVIEYVDVDLR